VKMSPLRQIFTLLPLLVVNACAPGEDKSLKLEQSAYGVTDGPDQSQGSNDTGDTGDSGQGHP